MITNAIILQKKLMKHFPTLERNCKLKSNTTHEETEARKSQFLDNLKQKLIHYTTYFSFYS